MLLSAIYQAASPLLQTVFLGAIILIMLIAAWNFIQAALPYELHKKVSIFFILFVNQLFMATS